MINQGSPGGVASFSVRVGCSAPAVSLSGMSGRAPEHSRAFERIAPSANPIKRAKSFISEYAGVFPSEIWPRGISGCGEASIVRSRSIALERMRSSISGVEFRFRVPS